VLRETSLAAALLSERDPFRTAEHGRRGPREYGTVRTRSDVADMVLALQVFHAGEPPFDPGLELHPGAARNVLRTAEQLYRVAEFSRAPRAENPARALMRALLAAFPDRVAKLRPGTQDRALMVGGRGVRIDGTSRVRGEPLLLAIEINDAGGEARARLVSAIDRTWLRGELLHVHEELFFNPTKGQVEARLRTYWIDLMLEETPVTISDWAAAAEILAVEARHELHRLLPASDTAAGSFLARVRWLAEAIPELRLPDLSDTVIEQMLPTMCYGLRSLEELRSADWLSLLQNAVGRERLDEIDRLAPAQFALANGNRHTIIYESGKPPMLAVRIQEMFGTRETPAIGGGRIPLLLHLLGPNYRTQQITTDLASFWQNGYPEVKKELRRRYPKHAWPDDPLAAPATRSGLKRQGR
jgi:ATP-dependent helicase HrpB